MNPRNASTSFEIFGYDFMITATGHVYLIEVNSNPCLELSSRLLKDLIPKMIDDAFALTVDVLFPIN
jgi:tubulin--tyrosine ligase/tubulin polyglutamylase TTLL9